MKKDILIILFITTLSSCTIPMRLFNPSGGFTYKYDGQNTGLDTIINLDGYYRYVFKDSNGDSNYDIKFSADGLICNTMSNAFEKKFINSHVFWGRYLLCGDTIKTQTVVDDGIVGGIFTSTNIFLIKSRNSIACLRLFLRIFESYRKT